MTELPSSYQNFKHASEEGRTIASEGMILRVIAGGEVYGTSTESGDRDEMGVCIEPPAYVTGLKKFEQFQRHTAWDKLGGTSNRSQAGDLDVTIYSLRKFAKLATDGNPTILMTLFTPPEAILYSTDIGLDLLQNRDKFISMQAADRFLGYLHSQREGMLGSKRTNRPELVDRFGYDTKFAAHAVRLGLQGCELLSKGKITLPMKDIDRDLITKIKKGAVSLGNIIEITYMLENLIRTEKQNSKLPEQPDYDFVNSWLHDAHTKFWN